MSVRLLFIIFIILMQFSVVAFAQQLKDDPCKELIQFMNQPDGIISEDEYHDFSSRILENDEKKREAFEAYIRELHKKNLSPNDIEDDCKENIRKFTRPTYARAIAIDSTKLIERSRSAALIMIDPKGFRPLTVKQLPKWVNGHCSESPEPFCNGNGPVVIETEFNKLAINQAKLPFGPADEPYTYSDCNCLETLLDRNPISREKIIVNARNDYAEIDKVIFEAAGKKFLNDFALFYEDIRYYDVTSGWALKDKADAADGRVFCSEPKDFQIKVQEQCGSSLSAIDQEARISAIFGSYGNKFNAAPQEFAGSFKGILNDFESPDKSYTRGEFDKVRFGINSSTPEIITANEIVTVLIQDKDVQARLNSLIDSGETPLNAIKSILTKESPDSLKKLLRKMNNSKSTEFNESLYKTIGHANFGDEINSIFGKATALNPGLKSLLMDPGSFKSVSSSLGKKGDFLSYAEKHGQLKSHFKNRCEGLQKKFAEAVCTPPSDLRAKVDRKDLISLLTKNKIMKPNQNLAIDMAICASNMNKVSNDSVFSSLDIDVIDPKGVSDFHNTKNKQGSMYSRAAENRENPAIVKISSAFDYKRVSSNVMVSNNMSSMSDSASSRVSPKELDPLSPKSDRNDAAEPKTHIAEEIQPTILESALAKASSESQAPTNSVTGQQAVASAMIQPASVAKEIRPTTEAISAVQEKPFQTELTNVLSQSKSPKTKALVGNLSESEARELLEYRRKAIVNNEQSVIDAETKKMEVLKAEYEELENKLETLKKEAQAPTKKSQISGEGYHGSSVAFQEKTNTTFEGGSTTGGQDSFGSARGDFSAQAGAAAVRNISGQASAAAPGREGEAKADNKLIVVSSQGSGQNSEDPSRELINYLAKNETDTFTLMGLKESGLIFKVEVNENGQKEVKTKLIKYNELTPEAKLLVDRRLSQLKETELKNLTDLEKKVLKSKSAYSLQALRLEILSISRQ